MHPSYCIRKAQINTFKPLLTNPTTYIMASPTFQSSSINCLDLWLHLIQTLKSKENASLKCSRVRVLDPNINAHYGLDSQLLFMIDKQPANAIPIRRAKNRLSQLRVHSKGHSILKSAVYVPCALYRIVQNVNGSVIGYRSPENVCQRTDGGAGCKLPVQERNIGPGLEGYPVFRVRVFVSWTFIVVRDDGAGRSPIIYILVVGPGSLNYVVRARYIEGSYNQSILTEWLTPAESEYGSV